MQLIAIPPSHIEKCIMVGLVNKEINRRTKAIQHIINNGCDWETHRNSIIKIVILVILIVEAMLALISYLKEDGFKVILVPKEIKLISNL